MLVTYAGHRVDVPGSGVPRFAARDVPAVARRVLDTLQRLRPRAVVGAAAAGADLIVLDAAMQVGAEVHLVLPYPADVFRARSVADCGADWTEAYDRLLAQVPADQVRVLDAGDPGEAYERANVAIIETALALAAKPDGRTEPLLALVVRNRRDGVPPSLTDHFADLARARGLALVEIDSAG